MTEELQQAWQCRCIWRGERCPNRVTQEDGMCDWCGTRRSEDMAGNPLYDATSDTLASTGVHDAIPGQQVGPYACWYPNSGRTLADG